MKLNNKTYDVLKWALFIFVPALIALIGTLAELYGYDAQTLITVISAIATFVGAITGISNRKYNKEEK
jgi:putative effector of murein hydrolase LrgA (UPF0299 family)